MQTKYVNFTGLIRNVLELQVKSIDTQQISLRAERPKIVEGNVSKKISAKDT